MKRKAIIVATLGCLFGAGLMALSPREKQSGVSEAQTVAAQGRTGQQQEAATFTGTIVKYNDRFVLKDEAAKTWYDLDDQKSAGKFAGKRVRVTGTFDASDNTIIVQTIEEAGI
jgi:Protein of unknown function (DUF5818)